MLANNWDVNVVFDDDVSLTYGDYQFRMAIFSAVPSATSPSFPFFSWTVFDDDGSVTKNVRLHVNSTYYGFFQWTSSLADANTVLQGMTATFHEPGEYRVELVVLDNGRAGVCPDDLEGAPDNNTPVTLDSDDIRTTVGREADLIGGKTMRCNMETRATLTLTTTNVDDTLTFVSPP